MDETTDAATGLTQTPVPEPPRQPPAELPPQPALAAERCYRVVFNGDAKEYFRIWIVNLALTILTLGIYSAWAKVRKRRYFYEHTTIDGDGLEYRGAPWAILKGRIIAVAVVTSVYTVSHFAPRFLWIVLVAAVFAVPWLLVRSFAFNAHNSAIRNIRCGFHGGYWRCLGLLVGYGLLTIVTAGLGYFYLKTRLTEFIMRNHAYGETRFFVPDLKKAFFAVYSKLIGLGLVVLVITFVVGFTVGSLRGSLSPNSPEAIGLNILGYALYLGLFAYVRSRIVNETWNRARLGLVRFRSTLGARRLYAIYLVNVVAILATLGLATPWAVMRTYRYRADNFFVLASGTLDGLRAVESRGVDAVGEEVGEMLDMDFSL